MDWSAFGAVATAAATLVALGLGLLAERRARDESEKADQRLAAQMKAQADTRAREFLTDRLLQLSDAYATTIALAGQPAASEATQRLLTFLQVLPPEYATILRAKFQVKAFPEFGTTWKKYAPEDASFSSGNVDPTWAQAELGANLAEVSGI